MRLAERRMLKVKSKRGQRPLNHVTVDQNKQIMQVACKLCHEVIAGMMVYAVEQRKETDGTIVQIQKERFAQGSAYREIKIVLEDPVTKLKSAHVTHLCADCKNSLLAIQDPQELKDRLEEIYACDMYEWMQEEKRAQGKIDWTVNERRVPLGLDRSH